MSWIGNTDRKFTSDYQGLYTQENAEWLQIDFTFGLMNVLSWPKSLFFGFPYGHTEKSLKQTFSGQIF